MQKGPGAAAAAAGGGGAGDELKEEAVVELMEQMRAWFDLREEARQTRRRVPRMEDADDDDESLARLHYHQFSPLADVGEEEAGAEGPEGQTGPSERFLSWPWENGDPDSDVDLPRARTSLAWAREHLRLVGRPNLDDLRQQVRSRERRETVFWALPNAGCCLRMDTRRETHQGFEHGKDLVPGAVYDPDGSPRTYLGFAVNPVSGDPFCWATPCVMATSEGWGGIGATFVCNYERDVLDQYKGEPSEDFGNLMLGDDDDWVMHMTLNVVHVIWGRRFTIPINQLKEEKRHRLPRWRVGAAISGPDKVHARRGYALLVRK